MPRKLSEAEVKQLFHDAGYKLATNFKYINSKHKHKVRDLYTMQFTKMSLQQLRYKLKHNQRPLWSDVPLAEFMYQNVQHPSQPPSQPQQQTPFERFVNKHTILQSITSDQETLQQMFELYKQMMQKLNRKQLFTYVFEWNQELELLTIVLALGDSIVNIQKTNDIVLDLLLSNGKHRYFHVNATTINDLLTIITAKDQDYDVTDSANNMLLDNYDYDSITFTFTKRHVQTNVRAGFFPMINTDVSTDLSKYGIYHSIDDVNIVEPCIITAFKSSNIFTENELNQLADMIRVRCFPQSELKQIAELFKVNIYVRHYKYNSSSHIEFNNPSYTRSLKLMIFMDHYMICEQGALPLIKQMIKKNTLRPMTNSELDSVLSKILTTQRSSPLSPKLYSNSKPIIVKDASKVYDLNCFNQYLFGYKPEPDEVPMRIKELQQFVNSLNLRHHVNVRSYKRFSTLMQKIMYEYGCFDDVYELTGELSDNIRSSLTYPKRVLTTDQINEKVYYLDFNGAFCSFMTHIPTGPNPITSTTSNTKVNELIHTMYQHRLAAKREHNDKLAKTIKFIMCSCYGTSIIKPKFFKNKYVQDIEKALERFGDLVITHNDSNFIQIKQTLVSNYSHPQFAKVILDGFNNKMNELKSIVNVLFQNFDAIVVTESDYNKLNELGYIHPTELGKLKVEHIFTSMVFKNKCKWYGVNEDGTVFYH